MEHPLVDLEISIRSRVTELERSLESATDIRDQAATTLLTERATDKVPLEQAIVTAQLQITEFITLLTSF